MRIVTVTFLVTPHWVWLAPKKRKIGIGKLNGYGGKVEMGETIIQSAVRETRKESCINLSPGDLREITVLDFFTAGMHQYQCYIFLATRWYGTPQETEEMGKPERFPRDNPPVHRMMLGDDLWVPEVLKGRIIPHGGYIRRNLEMTEFVGSIPSAI